MDVIGTIETQDKPLDCTVLRICADRSRQLVHDAVQEEKLLSVYVNDILTMQLGCSVTGLAELVVGRLFTEGLIESADEIDCLSVCEQALRADVYLHSRNVNLSQRLPEVVPTCCTTNKVLDARFVRETKLSPVSPRPFDSAWIFHMARVFAQDKTGHARTRGVHSAYLATPFEVLCMREDIGRHNAFDKVIGWALLGGIDLSECMVFTSGRIPTDMAVKAIRAGIPILATKTVATDKAIELARSNHLTLISEATPESFDVLNDGTRA